jgi:hypothetical protein
MRKEASSSYGNMLHLMEIIFPHDWQARVRDIADVLQPGMGKG